MTWLREEVCQALNEGAEFSNGHKERSSGHVAVREGGRQVEGQEAGAARGPHGPLSMGAASGDRTEPSLPARFDGFLRPS